MVKKSLKNNLKELEEKKKDPSTEGSSLSVVDPSGSNLPAEKEINPEDLSEIKKAAKKIGVGLEDYLRAIKEALSAKRSFADKFGEVHTEADHEKRLKAALLGLEVEGYIKAKGSTTDNSKHTHVTYAWLQAPAQVGPMPRAK